MLQTTARAVVLLVMVHTFEDALAPPTMLLLLLLLLLLMFIVQFAVNHTPTIASTEQACGVATSISCRSSALW
jgi:uncharacterized membrane protein